MENINNIITEHMNVLDWQSIDRHSQITKVNQLANGIDSILVVIGIGGSYLGAKAVIDALIPAHHNHMVLFIGQSLSALDMEDTLDYLKDMDFYVNVISKSGSTMETMLTFHLIQELMRNKYGDEMHKRIIATTSEQGMLRDMAVENNWAVLDIPELVGGRYSVFTPVGLFPMAVAGIDIKSFVQGARICFEEGIDDIIKYAIHRHNEYVNENKKIEILVTYESRLEMLTEWWKQLYGESEGKDGVGIFPANAIFTRDLHSLGQLIQDGERNIIETILVVKNIDSDLTINNYNGLEGLELDYINKQAYKGAKQAHIMGGVPIYEIEMERLDELSLGKLMYFFMSACVVSARLLKVNPFDQPGVEAYKSNIKKLLK